MIQLQRSQISLIDKGTMRQGGILYLTVDGQQYAARGNFTVMPSSVRREGIAGQDAVHGYTEKPVVPSIKGNISTVPGLSLETLQAITNSTILVQLANGSTYTLAQAWTKAAFEIDPDESKIGLDLCGDSCIEI